MKKFVYYLLSITIALLICLTESFAQTGWSWQNPLPQGNTLRSASSISQNSAVAVGDYGTIVRTSDGGSSWKISPSGTEMNLYGVHFADENNGWAVGVRGTILHSSNGGIDWQVQLQDTLVFEIRDVYFSSSSEGVAIGGHSSFRTTNGGETWTKQSISQISTAYGVFFTSRDTGYVVGSVVRGGKFINSTGVVLKTTDGCTTWTLQDSVLFPSSIGNLNDVQFVNSTTGLAVGDNGIILKTTNAGTNWTTIQAGITDPLAQVCWMNSSTAVAVSALNSFGGSSGGGKIFQSTDAGNSWSLVQSGTTNWLYAVTSWGSGSGIAVGDYGTILRTTNTGTSWQKLTTGSTSDLFDIYFTSPTNAYVVGINGTILSTTNGGTDWMNRASGTTINLKGVHFLGQSIGTAVGDSGTIIRTTDGGITWSGQQVNVKYNLNAVRFIDANNGFVVGQDPSIVGGGAVMYRTTNGGVSWSFQSVTPNKYLSMITFLNANIGVIVGGNSFTNGGVILRTSNGGITWMEQTSPQNDGLYDVSFANTTVGFAVGVNGIILRTADGGISWTKLTSGTNIDLFGIDAVDTSVAIAVGAGTILRTTNGGATWASQPSNTKNGLLAVFFNDATTGTIVGAGGTILRMTGPVTPHTQTEYFNDAGTDTMYVSNTYYEVALLKANGSLISIKDKTSNQFISTATTVENLWCLEFYNNPPLLSTSFRPGQADSFSYTWDASASRLSLQYNSNPVSVRRVSVTVTLEPSQSSYLDLSLQVQNNYGDTLSIVGFPKNFSFHLTDLLEAVLPVMPGIKFNQQFFIQKRSWLWGDYPRPFVFADYIFFRTHSSTLSMYHIVEDNLTPTVGRPLYYEQNSQGEFYRFGHDFIIVVPSGNSYRTPRIRIRVGEDVLQNVENFRNDAGLNATPSTREKLGSLYEKVASAYVGEFSPSGNLSDLGLRLSNREGYKKWLSQFPSPALLFFSGWQERGGDENNPDWFPVDASLGTTEDLTAMADTAKQLGHLLMPYINPTFWDDESPTMRTLNPLQVAMLERNGSPKIEGYGTKGGYGVCPYSPFVLDRLERALQEFRQYLDPHLIFQDQVGARSGLDFNPYEPKPWALAQGWREYSLRFKSNNWVTEFGYDRLVSSHVGFWWSTVPEDYQQWGDFGNASWGRDTWEYFPIVHMMARDKIFFYNAADYQVQSKLSLSWCMGMGLFLSSTLVRDIPAPAKKAWLSTISDFQKYAIAPYAHERVRNYLTVTDSVTSTRFETHSILVNWSKSNTYQTGQHILSKEGCLATSDDGKLTAGIFTRFNGKDLTAGDHFLIVRQFADSIVVHHPQGPSTKLSLTIPTNWGTNPDVHVYAFTNDVTFEATKTVAGGTVEFDLKDSVNNGRVVRYTIAHGPIYLTSPQLLQPADGVKEVSRAPLLSWSSVIGAKSYRVELALTASFPTVFYSRTVFQSTNLQIDTLMQGTTFYWRVRALDSTLVGSWSEVHRFGTAGNNLNDGLVAYFPLNGNANNFIGNDTGTIFNGVQPAPDRFGVAGRAYDFNGTNGYIEFPESQSVLTIEKEVSVAVWVKPRSYKQEAGVMLRDQSWNLLLQNGQATGLIFDENGNQNRTSSSQQAPLNTWSNIAFTYDGSTIRVFMNGQQTGELAFAASRIGNINETRNPTLGKGIGNNQHYFDGVIDEVFVFNRRLSNAEIALLAQYQGLAAPALQSPANGDTVVTRTPLLIWLAVPDAVTYHLQLSLNPGFSSFVFQDSTLIATSVKAPLLALDTTYYWRMRTMNGPIVSDWSSAKSFKTNRTITGVEKTAAIPKEFALLQNYPNPFNPATNIEFHIAAAGFVSLEVFDLLGRKIATLVNDYLQPGSYKVKWDARYLSSGMYLYRLKSNDHVQTRSLLFLR